MKPFIYPEMMVHVALCTSKEPKNVLILSQNSELLETEVIKHNGVNASFIPPSVEALRDASDGRFDVVVCDSEVDAAILAHINRVLVEDGLMVCKHPSLDEKIDENKALMQIMANYFKIIMPFNIGDKTTALLASKEYHPTADINLQRADMLDGLQYYNSDIHPAAFAMPNYIRKEYLGIIKN